MATFAGIGWNHQPFMRVRESCQQFLNEPQVEMRLVNQRQQIRVWHGGDIAQGDLHRGRHAMVILRIVQEVHR
jgi:hypothetical protein